MDGVFIKPELLLATTPALSATCSSRACRRLWCLRADHPHPPYPLPCLRCATCHK